MKTIDGLFLMSIMTGRFCEENQPEKLVSDQQHVFSHLFYPFDLVHVILPINCIFPDTVNDNMGMDVTGAIMPIRMSDNQCLITRKVFSGKIQT